MTGKNTYLPYTNINAYIKFGQTSTCSQDIERKRNSEMMRTNPKVDLININAHFEFLSICYQEIERKRVSELSHQSRGHNSVTNVPK